MRIRNKMGFTTNFLFYLGVFQRGVASHKGGAAGRATDKDVSVEGDIHEDPLRLQVHNHHVLDGVQAVHLAHVPEHGQCVLKKETKKFSTLLIFKIFHTKRDFSATFV